MHFALSGDTLMNRSYAFLQQTLPESERTLLEQNSAQWIRDIEMAVNTCREQLVSGALPFDVFCEYVLPVRLQNEPIEFWREDCLRTYSHLQGERTDTICNVLQNKLRVGRKRCCYALWVFIFRGISIR